MTALEKKMRHCVLGAVVISCAFAGCHGRVQTAEGLHSLAIAGIGKGPLQDEALLRYLVPRAGPTATEFHATDCTTLHVAARLGDMALAKLALEAGESCDSQAEVIWREGEKRFADSLGTPLHVAARCGQTTVTQWLLAHGASAGTRDRWNNTALHYAAIEGHTNVISLLLANQAEVNAAGNDGMTALLWAADSGHAAVCRLLIAKGARLELANGHDQTPLFKAAANGHAEAVRVLIQAGADPNHTDDLGMQPDRWAKTEAIRKIINTRKSNQVPEDTARKLADPQH